jgi:hypothetical protein
MILRFRQDEILKLKKQPGELMYRIALAGVVFSLAFGMSSSRNAYAQSAASSTSRHYLPLVLQGFPPITQYALTVNKSGSGSGTVTSSPTGINCGSTCSAAFDTNTTVTLSAVASSGSTFSGWSGGGCSGSGNCVVMVNAAISVTATFNLNTFELRVGLGGLGSGTVTSSPAGIDCGSTCFYSFPANTVVTLTATPTDPSIFAGWTEGVCSGTGTCQVTMSSLQQIVASFNIPCSGIANCDFESGSNGQWTEYSLNGFKIIYLCSDPSVCNDVTPHSGVYLAWLGGANNETSYLQQQVFISSSTPFLTYWQWIESDDFCGSDYGTNYDYVQVLINGTQVDKYDLCTGTSTVTWNSHNIDLTNYVGQSVTLQIRVTTDDTNISNFFLDDVNLLMNPLTLGSNPGLTLNSSSTRIPSKK